VNEYLVKGNSLSPVCPPPPRCSTPVNPDLGLRVNHAAVTVAAEAAATKLETEHQVRPSGLGVNPNSVGNTGGGVQYTNDLTGAHQL